MHAARPDPQPVAGHNPGAPQRQRPNVFPFKFHGKGMDLASIVVKNALLSILTFGINGFWGKVRVRKFLWHNTEFFGHRFSYHGTGGELLKGFVKIVGLFVAIQIVSGIALKVAPKLGIIITPLLGFMLLPAFAYAIFASQRYLYSRTSWRGIRLGMNDASVNFMVEFIKGYVLTILTLSLYFPIWQNNLYRIRINASGVGTLSMRYTGQNKTAFQLYLRSLPLIILTLGVYFIWYRAKVSQFRANQTWIGSATMGSARGHLNLSGQELFALYVENILMILITFGLATPWVIARNMGFFLNRFAFVGDLQVDRIQQLASKGSAAGDSMASLADVGLGL